MSAGARERAGGHEIAHRHPRSQRVWKEYVVQRCVKPFRVTPDRVHKFHFIILFHVQTATLLNLLLGDLKDPSKGKVERNGGARIAVFTQHHMVR
jgi:ATPase subunit of ABC transporter with duplicated ATPase domains